MNLWSWLIASYAVFTAGLIWYATHIALSGPEPERRRDAYKVLKLVGGTGTGASAMIATVARLHESGIL